MLRFTDLADQHVRLAPGKDAGEGIVMASNLLPHGDGEVGIAAVSDAESSTIPAGDAQLGQFLRILDGQAAQAHRVD